MLYPYAATLAHVRLLCLHRRGGEPNMNFPAAPHLPRIALVTDSEW
jgi:hypothetical protein